MLAIVSRRSYPHFSTSKALEVKAVHSVAGVLPPNTD